MSQPSLQTASEPGTSLLRAKFARDVLDVAPECLGMVLVAHTSSGCTSGRIVEVEAYRGPEDRAAHSYGGRRTARTEAMFGPPGHAYVFVIYGIHHHVNIVTGAVDEPRAVLIRALEPLTGEALMQTRRGRPGRVTPLPLTELCSGPGKLCQALDIDRRFNGSDLLESSGAPVERLELRPGCAPRRVGTSPRIGIDYAGDWAGKSWRFYDLDSAHVSRTPHSSRSRKETH